MLSRFECENFRGFKKRLVFDLTARTYEFNSGLIKNGTIKNCLIFGRNGSGKSSLGVAIFDIVRHLTDNRAIDLHWMTPYVNLDNSENVATFKYVFKFAEGIVTYQYEKLGPDQLVHESLWFGETLVIDWNYSNGEGNFYDEKTLGSVNLEKLGSGVSVVKYAYRTQKSESHVLLSRFMKFVESMLWYRRLSSGPAYAGFQMKSENVDEAIIQQGKLKEFEEFLRDHGLNYDLYPDRVDGRDVVMVHYAHGSARFTSVASSGTLCLELFFYWSIAAFASVSLLFIDEYDAYVHFESSKALLERLNQSQNFQVFLTTHNTYLMQNALTRPDACYILGDNRIVNLCEATDKEIRLAHNLEKMYTHGVFCV